MSVVGSIRWASGAIIASDGEGTDTWGCGGGSGVGSVAEILIGICIRGGSDAAKSWFSHSAVNHHGNIGVGGVSHSPDATIISSNIRSTLLEFT